MIETQTQTEAVAHVIRYHETKTHDWVFQPVAERMNQVFDALNARFFAGKLPRPVISIGPDLIVRYGYYRIGRDDIGARHRIHLNSRHFGRAELQVGVTLLHECIHLWQHLLGDPGKRARYHNREFVDTAATCGFEARIGSGETIGISSKLAAALANMGLSPTKPMMVGMDPTPISRPRRTHKLICECGQEVWVQNGATPRIICDQCAAFFVRPGEKHSRPSSRDTGVPKGTLQVAA